MGAISLSFAMTIAGFFGMNITHGLEALHPAAFVVVVLGAMAGSSLIYLRCIRQLGRSSALQNERMRAMSVAVVSLWGVFVG
eukprot:1031985-Rhodomonas_salina.1